MNKLILVFSAMCVIFSNAFGGKHRNEAMQEIISDCKTKTEATDDDIKTLFSNEEPTTEQGWCLVGCVNRKTGLFDEDNKFNIEKLKENAQEMKTTNADGYTKFITNMEQCKSEVENDPNNYSDECTAAKKLGECYLSIKN